jgi:hypothetical protein
MYKVFNYQLIFNNNSKLLKLISVKTHINQLNERRV